MALYSPVANVRTASMELCLLATDCISCVGIIEAFKCAKIAIGINGRSLNIRLELIEAYDADEFTFHLLPCAFSLSSTGNLSTNDVSVWDCKVIVLFSLVSFRARSCAPALSSAFAPLWIYSSFFCIKIGRVVGLFRHWTDMYV